MKTNRRRQRLLILARRSVGLWQSTALLFTSLATVPIIAVDVHGASIGAGIVIAAAIATATSMLRIVLSDVIVDASDVAAIGIGPVIGSIPEMR